jgi:hypothetical protein
MIESEGIGKRRLEDWPKGEKLSEPLPTLRIGTGDLFDFID